MSILQTTELKYYGVDLNIMKALDDVLVAFRNNSIEITEEELNQNRK